MPSVGRGRYPALTATNYLSSLGGEIALFERATIDQIAADLLQSRARAHSPDEHLDLQWRGDELHVTGIAYDLGGRTVHRWHDVVRPEHDGRYALGAYTWT